MKNLFNNKSALIDSTGYSLVGTISFIFGIIWALSYKADYTDNDLYNYFAILIITFPIMISFCYSYSYAISANLNEYEEITYLKCKLFLYFLIFIAFILFILSNIFTSFFNIKLLVIYVGLYYICFNFSAYLYHKFLVQIKSVKATLIFPSFMLIAFNIYSGSSLPLIKNGNVMAFIPYILFLLFIPIYIYLVKKKIKRFYTVAICSLIIYTIIILIIKSFIKDNIILQISFTTFLSVFTALYLLNLEGWYRFYKMQKFLAEKVRNRHIKLLTWIPIIFTFIVFICFPFQNFNFIYLFGFVVGNTLVKIIWLIIYKNNISDFKLIKWARSILGIGALLILILDSLYGNRYLPKLTFDNQFNNATLIISVSSLIISILAFINNKKEKLNNILGKIFNDKLSYALSVEIIILFTIFLIFLVTKESFIYLEAKVLYNIQAMAIYIILSVILYVFYIISNIKVKTKEDKA